MEQSSQFLRVATATPELKVADTPFNTDKIIESLLLAKQNHIQVLSFPELSLTGYTAADLFYQEALLDACEQNLARLLEVSLDLGQMVFTIGMPVRHKNSLYNAAILIQAGRIIGAVPKMHLPNSWEFYENRWFTSGYKLPSQNERLNLAGQNIPFGSQVFRLTVDGQPLHLGIEICEDLWVPIPPSTKLALAGASLIINLSASNELVGKKSYRRSLIRQHSASLNCAYLYADAGPGESTTDLVFSGHSLIAENGKILAESELFSEGSDNILVADIDLDLLRSERRHNKAFAIQTNQVTAPAETLVSDSLIATNWTDLRRFVDPHPFVPADPRSLDEHCDTIFAIQAEGLIKRLKHTGTPHVVLGISGGLDSTLAFLVCIRAYKKMNKPLSDIIAVTLPGMGTSNHTYTNAMALMKAFGVTVREISIVDAVNQHFRDIGHDPNQHDITFENSQARERTQILMDIANQVNGLVIGTGDLSELALGWCTYNGDQMSMYGVNASVPKTLVKHLCSWQSKTQRQDGRSDIADILDSIVATPISPELLPLSAEGEIAQHTEESTGPYELHDFFLYHVMRYGARPSKVLNLAKHAFRGNESYPPDIILFWLKVFYRRFFSQQFKRSAMPDGPKVGTVSLSPRGDWRMPSDAVARIWLEELEKI